VSAESKHLNRIPLTELKGVGAAVAQKFEKLHIRSVQDLLFHLPTRYEDRTRVTPIGSLMPGMIVLVEGEVSSADIQFGKKKSLKVNIRDLSGFVTLRFYFFGAGLKQKLIPGARVRAWGEARRGAAGLEFYHPELTIMDSEQAPPPLADRLTSIYPTTEGLQQKTFRKLQDQALQLLQGSQIQELLPKQMQQSYNLPPMAEALRLIHTPPAGVSVDDLKEGRHPAVLRMATEELIAHNISLLKLKGEYQADKALALPRCGQLIEEFLAQLPYSLTGAQSRVCEEIAADLVTDNAMLRLVQGDVGAGKTVVAAMAALYAIENGAQAVLMAPTEILAEQHLINFKAWFEPLGIKVAWLVGKQGAKERREALALIASGEASMIVGTHALFQESVEYHKLALAIIDEQHRFGVDQRLALRERGTHSGQVPHQLVMTATPIPRTLAMTAYADLDCSVIDELPPGRTPIKTVVISDAKRDHVIDRVRHACLSGQQAYWVCTLIEESEVLEAQAAEATAQQLKEMLPELSIGLVHGRLKPAEKAQIMDEFKQGQHHLLVATTVIEVGVDVPNATVMIIENPERLGLAQLHQLRGRVGRGSKESFCLLLYSTPLSANGRERLSVLRDSTDGFVIAEKDLEIRGAGELLGRRQTGEASFKVANLERDAGWLPLVQEQAGVIYQQHSELVQPLIDRWLAGAEIFANA